MERDHDRESTLTDCSIRVSTYLPYRTRVLFFIHERPPYFTPAPRPYFTLALATHFTILYRIVRPPSSTYKIMTPLRFFPQSCCVLPTKGKEHHGAFSAAGLRPPIHNRASEYTAITPLYVGTIYPSWLQLIEILRIRWSCQLTLLFYPNPLSLVFQVLSNQLRTETNIQCKSS